MFKRILVALDGSEFAERALAPAFGIAEKFGGKVILLRVAVLDEVSVAAGLDPSYYDLQRLGEKERRDQAEAYLIEVQAQWRSAGAPIRSEVVCGSPAEAIVEVGRGSGADLIVMSTHGRSGLNRLIYGSVAEAVLRAADVPVLLVPLKV